MENSTNLLLILILILQVISLLVLLNKKSVRQPELVTVKKDDRKEDALKNSSEKIRDSEKQQEQIRRTYDESINRNRDKDRDRHHHNRDREQNRDQNRDRNDRNDRNRDRNGGRDRDRDRNRDNRGNNGGRFNNNDRRPQSQQPSTNPAPASVATETEAVSQPQLSETAAPIQAAESANNARQDEFQHGRRAFVKRRNLPGEGEAAATETAVETAAATAETVETENKTV
ncbi:MAG: hypothetical protein JNL74_24535 [Fibrobacteres bacterium]|nr:hypothetical protein [Fibrobacterota bacterium]